MPHRPPHAIVPAPAQSPSPVSKKRVPDEAGLRPHPGNKRYLPSKPCARCGRTMTWRKRWARNWEDVRYCSDACRRRGAPGKT